MARKEIPRELSIYINDKQIVNSLRGITAEISKTNNEIRNLNKSSETYNEDLARLQGELTQLTGLQKEFKEEINATSEAMQDASGSFSKFKTGILSGDFSTAKAGLLGIKSEIIAVTKASLAFIATPIGLAIVALVGIAAATKAWFDYNTEVAEANKQTQAITNLSGKELDQARLRAKALSDTFDVDFKETLETAKALVQEFGISYDEALSQIQEGLIRGGASNDEYLDSLREYPAFFAKAGYSIEEFRNIVNAGYDLGIYSDKLPDAIKEFNLSITEQTKATKDALINAFGTDFTNKLLQGVNEGSISTKEALKQISEESKKVGLSLQQQQQLTADVFKGAGEDAGGALKIFDAVTKSYEDQLKPLTDLEQATKDVTEAELRFAQAKDEALKSDGFAVFQARAEKALISVKTFFYDTIKYLTNSNAELKRLAVDGAKKANDAYLDKQYEKDFGDYIARRKKRLGDAFDYEKEAAEKIASLKSNIQSTNDNNYKKSLQLEINAIQRATKNYIDAEGVKTAAKEQAEKAKDAIDKKASDAHQKEIDKRIAEEKKLQEAKLKAFEEGEKAIDDLIAKSLQDRSIASLKGLEKDIAQVTAKYATELEKYKDHTKRLKELQFLRDQEIQDLKIAKAKEYAVQISDIEKQLVQDKEVARLDALAAAATTDEERQYILIEKARYVADLEIQSDLEKELAKVENVENAEELKQAIRDKYAQKQSDNDVKFNEAEKAIKSDQVKWTELTEDQKLNTIRNSLNAASEAFNKGSNAWKAIKIAETTISTYQSAVSAFNSLSGIPIVGVALGTAAAGLAVVAGLKQVQNIAKTKIDKAPQFFYGGNTGSNPALGYDEHGPITGHVHKNEYVIPEVMTANPRYANTIAWIEQERTGKRMNKFVDGGGTSQNAVPNVVMAENESKMEQLLMAVLFRLENPIAPNLVVGYDKAQEIDNLNKEREASGQNGTISE